MTEAPEGGIVIDSGTDTFFDGIMDRELPYEVFDAEGEDMLVVYPLPIDDRRIAETREEYFVGVDGEKYSVALITTLLLNQVFFPPEEETDQDEGAIPTFVPASDKLSHAAAMRDFALLHLERLARHTPAIRRYLLSFACRERLYQAYAKEATVINIDGRTEEPTSWFRQMDQNEVHDIDVPHPPPGSDVKTRRLPFNWYQRFVHTAFVNYWIQWCTYSTYRTQRLLWTLFRPIAVGDAEAHAASTQEILTGLDFNFHKLNDPYTLLPIDYDPGAWILNNREEEKERIRGKIASLVGVRMTRQTAGRYHAIDFGPYQEVFRILQSRLNWLEEMEKRYEALPAVAEEGALRMPYKRTTTWMMSRMGMMCPGRNGGMFSRPGIMNAIWHLYRFRDDPIVQRQLLQRFRRLIGIPRISWQCGTLAQTVSTFGKSPNHDVAISAYDSLFRESYRYLELLMVPTVQYRVIPGVTDVINELFPCDFRIGSLPNDARVAFRPPMTLRVPGDVVPSNPEIQIDVGYIGSRRGTTFALYGTWLADTDDTESAISGQFLNAIETPPVNIKLIDVRYGPLSYPQPYPITTLDGEVRVRGVLALSMHNETASNALFTVRYRDRVAFTVRGMVVVSSTASGVNRARPVGYVRAPRIPRVLPELEGDTRMLMAVYYYHLGLLSEEEAKNYRTTPGLDPPTEGGGLIQGGDEVFMQE